MQKIRVVAAALLLALALPSFSIPTAQAEVGVANLNVMNVGETLATGEARDGGCFFPGGRAAYFPAGDERVVLSFQVDSSCRMVLTNLCKAPADCPKPNENETLAVEHDLRPVAQTASTPGCAGFREVDAAWWTEEVDRYNNVYQETGVSANVRYAHGCPSGMATPTSATGECRWRTVYPNPWVLHQCLPDHGYPQPSDGFALGIHGTWAKSDETRYHGLRLWAAASNNGEYHCPIDWYGNLQGLQLKYACGGTMTKFGKSQKVDLAAECY